MALHSGGRRTTRLRLNEVTVNLFVLGWGLSSSQVRETLSELRRTAAIYPHLNGVGLWYREPAPGVVIASVRSPDAVASPRRYLHTHEHGATLFDGLPIDPTGSLVAHRADALEANWDRLPETLEGRFCVVRLIEQPLSIEFITDPLGVEQVFVHGSAQSSLVSNSAGLVERATGSTELDPIGVSTLLALDFVGGDSTLRRDIRVVPAAQHWAWSPGRASWAKRTYWSLTAQAHRPERRVDGELVDEVAASLIAFCSSAANVLGSVNAPLTGGKDSRMLAAILVAAGIPARFWTKGDSGTQDVEIARRLASRYGLSHRIANRPTQTEPEYEPTRAVAKAWSRLTEEFVVQNDGLASLINLGNIFGQPSRIDRLAVSLTALTGESAREAFTPPYLFAPGASPARVRSLLPTLAMAAPRGLIRKEAFRLAIKHVESVVDRAAAEGVAVDNLPTVFYLEDRCRRWASNNPRELAQTEDKVVPFQTRPYVRSALSITAEDRWLERLHREVTRTMVPGMESEPPPDIPWRASISWPDRSYRFRRTVAHRLPHAARRATLRLRETARPPATPRAATTPYDEPAWIDANLASIREVCLSDSRSRLWAFIDRRELERLLAPSTSPALRRLSQLPLFAAITLFKYERIATTIGPAPSWPVDSRADDRDSAPAGSR
ncbi:MAG: hypothetical protein ACYDAK_11875 [Candidatus Limnocylindrales bacterium]